MKHKHHLANTFLLYVTMALIISFLTFIILFNLYYSYLFKVFPINVDKNNALFLLIIVMLMFLVVFFIYFYLISKKKINYIHYIASKIQLIEKGYLEDELEIIGNDELTNLSLQINEMMNRIKQLHVKEHDLEKQKYELITNLSHDLKTPLTSMIAYINILQDSTFDQTTYHEYMNRISHLSLKLKKQIDQLFLLVSIQEEKQKENKHMVNLSLLLEQLVMEYKPVFDYNKMKLESNIDANIDYLIHEVYFLRAIDNLFSNAIKYADKSQNVKLNVYEQENIIKIDIINSYTYLDNKCISDFIKRGFRDENAYNTDGFGLGLNIVYEIIQMHNGKFYIEIKEEMKQFKAHIILNKDSK